MNLIAYLKHPHWHLILVHFPISAFLGSFGFMVLHMITETDAFELAGYVTLLAGAAVMIPTTISGWFAWKSRYKGYKSNIFLMKIRVSIAMIVVSSVLVLDRTFFVTDAWDVNHEIWHILFFTGTTMLIAGAGAEGYFGGRLNHR